MKNAQGKTDVVFGPEGIAYGRQGIAYGREGVAWGIVFSLCNRARAAVSAAPRGPRGG